MNKLLKNDEDNATGDIQLLCKLWSGESASYHFVTEATQENDSNTTFFILRSTQIQNAAIRLFRMDKGYGLLDCFLITVPNTWKLTPEQEEEGTHYLADLPLQDFVSLFTAIYPTHKIVTRSYTLDPAATHLHKCLKTSQVNEVNTAIKNGEVPPKSEGIDFVIKVAVALSTLNYFINAMLKEDQTHNPAEQITEDRYKKAADYVECLHAQKEMFAEFVKAIMLSLLQRNWEHRQQRSTSPPPSYAFQDNWLPIKPSRSSAPTLWEVFRSQNIITAPKQLNGTPMLQKSSSLE